MKGPQVALFVAIGYILGRHRRFKLAIGLAVAGATGRLSGARGNLLEQGMKLVSSSPELEKIVGSVRGELFEAGKAAAKAAASRQVGSLSTKLQERAEALQHAADVAAGLEETTERAGGAARAAGGRVTRLRDTARRGGRARPQEEEEPYEDEYDEYEDEEYQEEPEEEPAPRRGAARERPSRGRARTGEAEEEPDEPDEEPGDEEEPPRGRVVRDQPAKRSRPVRRTRG
ncbi:hypothetical protein Sru01_41370 [Sphaerisporangium rufum]|uniref:Uncharacterized protein n=1 Tax=Sphaerisporangium rufum TaxID=1381558 RepID=A0A919V6A4_9ACTN|nr:hypothetical protein [Sphaerisporangium rufum]GII79155.1 hypothetical protein Sru01_41370 [Sphaerisporangium rufum]